MKIAVYIDGSNFYKYLKDKEISLPKGKKFNFKKFVNYLVGSNECISKRYYVGIMRNYDKSENSQKLIKGQQKFLAKMKNDGFIIKEGKIIYDSGKIREKGTDVKIAVDLVVGASDDLYDKAILISSDTDLIPAVNYLKYKNKDLEYIGFSHAPSLALIKHSNFSRLLSREDVFNFSD